MEGAPAPLEGIEIRTKPWLQTAHPNYLWLTRGFFVEIGKAVLDKGMVCYDIYQLPSNITVRTRTESIRRKNFERRSI